MDCKIEGVVIKPMMKHCDSRGWLSECFRQDEIEKPLFPVMAYISVTLPGVSRGPHEHLYQTDYFCFAGPSNFRVYIWDNRKSSPTYQQKQSFEAGENDPMIVIVPPKIVHAYKNIGKVPGYVFNSPNKLYAGWNKKEKVDEIRYEERENTMFIID